MRSGADISLISYGIMINQALKAAEELSRQGISAEVIKLSAIKPAAFEKCMQSLAKTGKLIVVEDCCSAGCVGEKLAAAAVKKNITLNGLELLNLGEGIIAHGKPDELMADYGVDAAAIVSAAKRLVLKDK